MALRQILTITGITVALMIITKSLIKKFTSVKLYYPLLIAIALFSTGFSLRLSNNQPVIDIGFFMTEISHLFVYALFTAALILGQEKYWKIK